MLLFPPQRDISGVFSPCIPWAASGQKHPWCWDRYNVGSEKDQKYEKTSPESRDLLVVWLHVEFCVAGGLSPCLTRALHGVTAGASLEEVPQWLTWRLAGCEDEDEGSASRAGAAAEELAWGWLCPGAGAGQRGKAQHGSVSPQLSASRLIWGGGQTP